MTTAAADGVVNRPTQPGKRFFSVPHSPLLLVLHTNTFFSHRPPFFGFTDTTRFAVKLSRQRRGGEGGEDLVPTEAQSSIKKPSSPSVSLSLQHRWRFPPIVSNRRKIEDFRSSVYSGRLGKKYSPFAEHFE